LACLKILDVLFIEPYDGGSHRAFREGLVQRSRHRITSLTLPARFWKWRMRGAAAWFADRINSGLRPDGTDAAAGSSPGASEAAPKPGSWDLIVTTGMLNVADLRGLLAPPCDRLPVVLYLHENQLTYPLSPEEEFDFHFGFTNILSALAADRVVFNSAFHRDLFLDGLPAYLGKMPEAVPRGVGPRLAAKSAVLPVGIERTPHPPGAYAPYLGGPHDPAVGPGWPRYHDAPLVLWNHRWEFDKRPDLFAAALKTLADEGIDFGVALLGDARGHEKSRAALAERLGARCLHADFVPDRGAYDRWLARADIVVSCAEQEYFGIAVAEAVHAGAYPLLPRRQVYPSLYGSRCRGRHLYDDDAQLTTLLRSLLGGDCGHVCSLPLDCDAFCWERLVDAYDRLFAETADAAVGS
jgi:glycosyltransferase involved in cell wall biosynthesis